MEGIITVAGAVLIATLFFSGLPVTLPFAVRKLEGEEPTEERDESADCRRGRVGEVVFPEMEAGGDANGDEG